MKFPLAICEIPSPLPMDPYGFLWIPMDPYGFLWIPKDSYGSRNTVIPRNFLGSVESCPNHSLARIYEAGFRPVPDSFLEDFCVADGRDSVDSLQNLL